MLNLSRLLEITQGKESLLKEFLNVYIENTPQDIKKLSEALAEDNSKQVYYFIHKLKSSAQSLGFVNGFKQLKSIEEQLLLNSPLPPIRGQIEKVVRECETSVLEARKLLEKYVSN